MHPFGKFGEVLADLNTTNIGCNGFEFASTIRIRFQIEGIFMAWATAHIQENARLVLCLSFSSVACKNIHPTRGRDATNTHGAEFHKVSAVQSANQFIVHISIL